MTSRSISTLLLWLQFYHSNGIRFSVVCSPYLRTRILTSPFQYFRIPLTISNSMFIKHESPHHVTVYLPMCNLIIDPYARVLSLRWGLFLTTTPKGIRHWISSHTYHSYGTRLIYIQDNIFRPKLVK